MNERVPLVMKKEKYRTNGWKTCTTVELGVGDGFQSCLSYCGFSESRVCVAISSVAMAMSIDKSGRQFIRGSARVVASA